MDNTNRKIRIAPALPLHDNARMDEETADALFADATELAYIHFDDVSDDHIEGVYARLILNHTWGLGDAGAVTVH